MPKVGGDDEHLVIGHAVERIYKAVDFGFKADYRNPPFF
jgi:hypothetical protein